MLRKAIVDLVEGGRMAREALGGGGSARVLASMLGPAWRGLVAGRARTAPATAIPVAGDATFDWRYARSFPELARLYEAAKSSQWNAVTDLDWAQPVDPDDPARPLLPEDFLPFASLPAFRRASPAERRDQIRSHLAWTLSQFLHGEQGALHAAAQVTEAVPWLDAKLYGSTQVVDEGRHVEVFHAYLTRKLEKLYRIDDNLYVVVDALMTDARWDVKFLGMQILVEGLALGAFGMIRRITAEPLLRDVLRYVITDEARHVHFGVLALERHCRELSERERRDREEWAFEVALLLRSRFLAHEFYDEYYGHALRRAEWDRVILASGMMALFRETMFRRIVPNLRRIGLLSDRIRPRYARAGLLAYEHERAAPDLSAEDLL
ncbi:ferritin-like domain-containing protein [Anaeromyxobacter oryzae]|uniref:Ferritin-like domain-containing protein n=1 Tax=Anaeromyxobacter oryzae TaxID=2918170 RepID=A0ABM7X4K1_9BACT|nr:ferritin-like domain-containing protein [Anaeromyxobacter oryzae]BDG06717.1 hypothetical protein AMOR_57130 [Anaeromyxobacter oryzae]